MRNEEAIVQNEESLLSYLADGKVAVQYDVLTLVAKKRSNNA